MNPGAIELQEIQVDKACQSMRCQCWTYNITDQFPIKSISEISGNMIVEVGPPHEGYTIETTVINKTINGKSKIISSFSSYSIQYCLWLSIGTIFRFFPFS